MGDPVTTGMIIGAVGGAATSKNPIEGAMMGGAPALGTTSAASGFAGGNLAAAQNALNPTFMQRMAAGGQGLMGDIGSLNKFMNANPTTSQMGMGLAKNLLAEDQPMPYAPAGQVSRGQSAPPMDYMSLLNPQNQTVIRPQQISLLG
jgi:hypothetical protein